MATATRTCSYQCILVFVFTFVCAFLYVSANEQQNGEIIWDPLPTGPKYNTTVEEPSLPLSSLFGLATGFIHKVPPKEIPWGKYGCGRTDEILGPTVLDL